MKRIAENLDYAIKEFVGEWREGESPIHIVKLFDFGLDGESPTIERDIDSLGQYLTEQIGIESLSVCEDRCNLVIQFDVTYLEGYYADRLQPYRGYHELLRFESCGWI